MKNPTAVAIAKEAKGQIAQGLRLTRLSYLDLPTVNIGKEPFSVTMQIPYTAQNCRVCALGALYVGLMAHEQRPVRRILSREMCRELAPYFSMDELLSIEGRFMSASLERPSDVAISLLDRIIANEGSY